jgi:hypothetical protein
VLLLVTHVQCSSGAKWQILWPYVLGERVVTEFHTVEGSGLIEIYRCLRNRRGDSAEDVCLVRQWVRCFKRSQKDIGDRSCSCQLVVAATSETVKESC